ncbi:nitrite reductase small subunit NirD [Streptomyces sp. NPDC051976]|uniref:nitrite reductase small subunit NirD n=1 Tax=Streptomyces sp. NPDC051976 TaxID=3154947 RepID=UPI0034387BA6
MTTSTHPTSAATAFGTGSATEHTTATATGSVQLLVGAEWFAVCSPELLLPGRGVAALLPDGSQAAVFRDSFGSVYAIDNIDPFTGAGVLAHGLTGTAAGRPYVASPLLKQRFDLATGACLDDDAVAVRSYAVRVV